MATKKTNFYKNDDEKTIAFSLACDTVKTHGTFEVNPVLCINKPKTIEGWGKLEKALIAAYRKGVEAGMEEAAKIPNSPAPTIIKNIYTSK